MDKNAIQKSIVQLLTAIGEDPAREGVRSTPERYADACEKLFEGYTQKPEDVVTVFDGENYDEMVVVKDIEFFSNCEHHILPFYGKAHIGYIPADKIIGLSKLPRLVDIYARRLQNQERLTSQIAGAVNRLIAPKGVGVVIEARHFCMMARGVEKQNSVVTTSAQFGLFKNNDKTRAEFLRLIGR